MTWKKGKTLLLGYSTENLELGFHFSTLSNFLLLMPEECEGGNGSKCSREMCLSFKDCVPEIAAYSSSTQPSLNLPSPYHIRTCSIVESPFIELYN